MAHQVDYLLTVRSAVGRSALLARTGHGYLPSAARVSASLAAVAVLTFFALGAARHEREPAPRFSRLAAALACALPVAFVAVEIVERLVAGAPLGTLSAPALVIGVGIQFLAAVLVAGGLVAAERAGARIARAMRPRPRMYASAPAIRVAVPLPPRPALSPAPAGVRAPPPFLGV